MRFPTEPIGDTRAGAGERLPDKSDREPKRMETRRGIRDGANSTLGGQWRRPTGSSAPKLDLEELRASDDAVDTNDPGRKGVRIR